MTGCTNQAQSCRKTLRPFTLKACRQTKPDCSVLGMQKHHLAGCSPGSNASSPCKKMRLEPLALNKEPEDSAESVQDQDPTREGAEPGEGPKQPEAARLGPRGCRFELECRLEVTNDTLSAAEEHMARVSAERATLEQQIESVSASLDVIKGRQSVSHQRLGASVKTSQKMLGDAKAALCTAVAKLEKLAEDANCKAAAVELQIKAAKEATACAEARISDLANTSPRPTPASGNDNGKEELLAIAEAARDAVEGQCAAMEAKLVQLRDTRAVVLASLVAQGGRLGEVGGQVVELTTKLDVQHSVAAELLAKAKDLGVAEVAEGNAASSAKVGTALPTRRPSRLIAVSPSLPELAGEYKLLPDAVNGRLETLCISSGPLRVAVAAWGFSRGLPVSAGTSTGAGVVSASNANGAGEESTELPGFVARSLQAAWMALPDELTSRWGAGSRVVDISIISAGA
eukprot:CAMPEP_0179189468 /NCGR_PEP_ID=MMETSP0796-20121207/94058_1 /TAXON_ID=73915 /ORGANISM="Pyrodinium bahamense, Strain pbaha01" /LENGTH=457 /DNA_ID=CAMNT_0020893605 /DNA_START=103 /DNA_END=1475 /DNA_ORIENTATION=-